MVTVAYLALLEVCLWAVSQPTPQPVLAYAVFGVSLLSPCAALDMRGRFPDRLLWLIGFGWFSMSLPRYLALAAPLLASPLTPLPVGADDVRDYAALAVVVGLTFVIPVALAAPPFWVFRYRAAYSRAKRLLP